MNGKMNTEIITVAYTLMEYYMSGNDGSHDSEHVKRVVRLALYLAEKEGITDKDTLEVIHLAAILHDIGDWKYSNKEKVSLDEFFESHQYSVSKKDRILHVIKNIGYKEELKRIDEDKALDVPKVYSFSNGEIEFKHKDPSLHTPELCIVQDADRIDALGAIGIARCLFFSATHGGIIHDSKSSPDVDMTNTKYISQSKKVASFHFYEKLFKLPLLMKTDTGRIMANDRIPIMKDFILSLSYEWILPQ